MRSRGYFRKVSLVWKILNIKAIIWTFPIKACKVIFTNGLRILKYTMRKDGIKSFSESIFSIQQCKYSSLKKPSKKGWKLTWYGFSNLFPWKRLMKLKLRKNPNCGVLRVAQWWGEYLGVRGIWRVRIGVRGSLSLCWILMIGSIFWGRRRGKTGSTGCGYLR